MKHPRQNKLLALAGILLLITFGVAILEQKAGAAAPAAGKITGTVKLNGAAPQMKPIDMSKDPFCAQAHAGNSAHLENVEVGASGGLANVVLYISDGLGTTATQAPAQRGHFEQKGCQYSPHVLAVDVDQQIEVTSNDQTSHNIHPTPDMMTGNVGWNRSQPPGAPPFDAAWKNQEIAIPVKCNIHPWMHGYMAVVKGPFAVTDNSGSFSISNVAPGSYTVTAWQEEYGKQTQKVTVEAGKSANADFTFKAK
jgi:hypothetical protein